MLTVSILLHLGAVSTMDVSTSFITNDFNIDSVVMGLSIGILSQRQGKKEG